VENKPHICTECGCLDFIEHNIKVTAQILGMVDADNNPMPHVPLSLPVEVIGWECQECAALFLHKEAMRNRIITARSKAAAELN
jgi:hypothetical protein